MLKVVRFIALPLLVGLSIGFVAAIAAVFGARLMMLGLSSRQEAIAFIGFIVCFGLFGLVDSANRFAAWLRTRNGNEEPGSM